MSNDDYSDLNYTPSNRDHGYECPHCGYVLTWRELDNGTRCDCHTTDEA